MPSLGGEAAGVAQRLQAGKLLMGCEDQFPSVSVTAPVSPSDFGDASIWNEPASSAPKVIALATYDEIVHHTGLALAHDLDPSWWDSLDDGSDAQAYIVAAPDQPGLDKVLIVGADAAGLQYGVLDWLRSLDQVDFDNGGTTTSWTPDHDSQLAYGGDATCSSYGTSCGTDAACWDASTDTWDEVTSVEWCPQDALSYPDTQTRMAFPAFADGVFLPRVLNLGFPQSCPSVPLLGKELDARAWFDEVVDCDRYDSRCQAALTRLDGLVGGRFNYALDESFAMWNNEQGRVNFATNCDPGYLWEAAWDYLDNRQVELLPSAYGLESRTIEEPISGSHRHRPGSWKASDYGRYGNVTHSEGLSVIEKAFQPCPVGTSTYLAPVMDSSYADAAAAPCSFLDSDGAVTDGPGASLYYDFEQLGGQTFEGTGPWELEQTDFWTESTSPGPFDDYVESQGTSTAKLFLPSSGEPLSRLYVVNLQVLVKSGGSLKGVFQVDDEQQEISFTTTDPGDFSGATVHDASTDEQWVDYSIVLRLPPSSSYGTATLTLTAKGAGLVFLDELEVVELDGMLHNMDEDSLRFTNALGEELASSCFEVHADAEAGSDLPAHYEYVEDTGFTEDERTALGWRPVFELDSNSNYQPTDYQGSIEVVESPCTNLDGGEDWMLSSGEDVLVSYRSWTHAGVWPKPNQEQEHYVFAPHVFSEDYWDDQLSPASQLDTLGSGKLGHTTGAGRAPSYVLVSDLGGEIRGFNRAFGDEPVDNDEKFASFYCKVQESANAALGGVGTGTCADMFSMTSFAPCDCSGWTTGSLTSRLLLAADMFTLVHNGGRPDYQVPYGGTPGSTRTTKDLLPANTTFLTWWHSDSKKQGATEVVGQEMAAALVDEIINEGFDAIGAPAWDPDIQRMWAAMAAAGQRNPNQDGGTLRGVAHYGWGDDDEGPQYMAQSGWYAWQAEWQLVHHTYLSDSMSLPGGNETVGPINWTSSGLSLVDDGVVRPTVGKRLRANGTSASWTGIWNELDQGQLSQPTWTSVSPGHVSGAWGAAWDQLLLRFYVDDLPASCVVEVDFEVDCDYCTTPVTAPATVQDDHPNADHRVIAARADLPTLIVAGSPALDGLQARAHITLDGTSGSCSGAHLDSIGLYQGIPWTDWPYAYEEKSLDDVWTSTVSKNATPRLCGQEALEDCKNVRTFEAR